MLQTVEKVLNILSAADVLPDQVLDQIRDYIRKKRSVTLDRMEFEQCRQERDETFDIFYLRLQRIAACADLCPECIDERMTVHVMVGIRDQDTRKKLLAFSPFSRLQQAVDLCRSEETTFVNEPAFVRNSRSVSRVSRVERERSP